MDEDNVAIALAVGDVKHEDEVIFSGGAFAIFLFDLYLMTSQTSIWTYPPHLLHPPPVFNSITFLFPPAVQLTEFFVHRYTRT